MPADIRYIDTPTDRWKSYATGLIPEDPSGVVLGPVVYTLAEINGWASGGTEYTRLAGSWGGNNGRTISNFPAVLTYVKGSATEDIVREGSTYAKCQAVLWAADGSATRRSKVVQILDSYKNVTNWNGDSGQQNKLNAGWALTNLCQAAWIIGYSDSAFDAFLRRWVRPISAIGGTSSTEAVLDWTRNPNWLASFCESRLAIGSYLRDDALWTEAKAYFRFRLPQILYDLALDAGFVTPMRTGTWPETETGAVSTSDTLAMWQSRLADTTYPFAATLTSYGAIPTGADGEITRDISHESMTSLALTNCARTILACGDTIDADDWTRLVTHLNWFATRANYYRVNGSLQAPAGTSGSPAGVDGNRWKWIWGAVKNLLGSAANTDVNALYTASPSMIPSSEVMGYDHQSAPLFAEGFA